jgi:hypothetical protein
MSRFLARVALAGARAAQRTAHICAQTAECRQPGKRALAAKVSAARKTQTRAAANGQSKRNEFSTGAHHFRKFFLYYPSRRQQPGALPRSLTRCG